MRVCVIGSPKLPDPLQVRAALDVCLSAAVVDGTWLTVVHGGARHGAEQVAHAWSWERHRAGAHVCTPVTVSPQWSAPCRPTCRPGHRRPDRVRLDTTCPSAPFYRNEQLLSGPLDIDTFLVWVGDEYRAAQHMWEIVTAAGRQVQDFRS